MSPRDYLRDMLVYLQDIATFTANGREEFMMDRKTQLAVIRAYEVVGEIAKRLPESLREANPHIDWRRLISFRDFLAHNYEKVILNNIWAAVQDLPRLRAAIEAVISQLPDDGSDMS